jgi:hypothetical protein
LIGIALIVTVIVITLGETPLVVAGENTNQKYGLTEARGTPTVCQSGEEVPRATTAVRMSSYAFTGPKVTATVEQGGHLISRGHVSSGWAGGAVTVPMGGLTGGVKDATVCFTFHLNKYETLTFTGAVVREKGSRRGLVRTEYMRPGSKSWWSQVSEVARRMGLGRAGSGTWNALLVLALMLGLTAVCVRTLLRELE